MQKYKIGGIQPIFFLQFQEVLVDPSIWPQPGERTGQADCDTNTASGGRLQGDGQKGNPLQGDW